MFLSLLQNNVEEHTATAARPVHHGVVNIAAELDQAFVAGILPEDVGRCRMWCGAYVR